MAKALCDGSNTHLKGNQVGKSSSNGCRHEGQLLGDWLDPQSDIRLAMPVDIALHRHHCIISAFTVFETFEVIHLWGAVTQLEPVR